MSCWFVIGFRSNITLVRCKYIYNYVNIELLLYFFVFYDSRLRVFQSASTDADIRTDRRGCYMAYFDAPKVAFCD